MNTQELRFRPFNQLKASLSEDYPVYIMVNPIEYHGPHLTLYTDYILSLELAKKLHEMYQKKYQQFPFTVWDTIHLGESPTRGPGSIPSSYKQLKSRLIASVKAIARIQRPMIVFCTFHGAPLHNWAIQEAIDLAKSLGIKAYNPFLSVLDLLFEYTPNDYQEMLNYIPNDPYKMDLWENFHLDFHGGFFESSLMRYLNPSSVDPNIASIPSCPRKPSTESFKIIGQKLAERKISHRILKEIEISKYALAWGKLKPFPGYTLHPHLANTAAGEYLTEKIIMHRYFEEFKNTLAHGKAQYQPPMKWAHRISFKGRIPLG